ncbi:hypothetical protein OG897_34280 [Streptomyces sp. NBC_00237]|nr:hypothetical protein [Streptomyces sp. NBC_00237]MCX5206462.1 hypothetical protein [Streptomyces sp. NBC_00237]
MIEIRDLLARVLDSSVELAAAGVGLSEAAYRVREAHGGRWQAAL